LQQERAVVTRTMIVNGAARVFEKHGYGDASLADVATEAGVTKGALYFHFKTKEELAQTLIAEQHRMVSDSAQKIVQGKQSSLQKLVLITRDFARQLIAESIVRAGMKLTLDAPAFGQVVTQPYLDWMDTVAHLIRLAQEEGDVRPELDSDAFGRFFPASFTGVQMVSNILTERADVELRVQQMWLFLLPALLARPNDTPESFLAALDSL